MNKSKTHREHVFTAFYDAYKELERMDAISRHITGGSMKAAEELSKIKARIKRDINDLDMWLAVWIDRGTESRV